MTKSYFLNHTNINKQAFFKIKMPLEKTIQKSELKSLLEKNTSETGLTSEEFKRATELIVDSEYSTDEDCWCCRMTTPPRLSKAIYDIGLCKGCASYALISRK